ncbi:MAG: SAM-dependent methyltransferase [Gammaproteobacteria bacterium]|nr:SAM-dependent methyltransferase [Gammaproteobacteria bacterium]
MVRERLNSQQLRPPVFAVMLISAAALAYEILLMRLFSIIQWHHFAYMVISLALLGYGVSGALLSLAHRWTSPHFAGLFVANAALFGVSTVVCFLFAQRLPFNTLEMIWDLTQWTYLLWSYLLLFIPFFFAANSICLAFSRFDAQISRIYAFDLMGAGLGALGIIALLYWLSPEAILRWLGVAGLLAAVFALWEMNAPRPWRIAPWVLIPAVLLSLLPHDWFVLQLSQYKALSQTLQISGARLLSQTSNPMGVLSLVANDRIPFRLAPGLSLHNPHEPPEQLALFIDGDAPTAITRFTGDKHEIGYLDYQTSALPYHLAKPDRLLILGLGGGSGLLQAKYHDVERIDAVELNPRIIELLTLTHADFSGWPQLQIGTSIHEAEARGYISSHDDRYDLIQVSLLDSAGAGSAGVHALNEGYLYTREALQDYLIRLTTDGMLSITRWIKLPPRDGLKLFATAIEALRESGVEAPDQRLMMIRGWNTSTLLVKKRPFTVQEIADMLTFCDSRAFDTVYYPGMHASRANRFNILQQAYFYEGATALLGNRAETYQAEYKFQIEPATDDRPYFFNFFKWESLPEILSLYRRGGFSLLELGYPVLLLTLLQAITASLVLILLPLWAFRQKGKLNLAGYHWRVGGYFLAIGLAYLFIEIAFLQKFILFLAHPIYAVAVVLCGFLIFSGVGSFYSQRIVNGKLFHSLSRAMLWLIAITLLYLQILPDLFDHLADLPGAAKALVSLTLIAPVAFLMGLPFPLGLSKVAARAPRLVPWAWGINGCASLLSSILASLLAIHLGFNLVVIAALLLYLGIGLIPLEKA